MIPPHMPTRVHALCGTQPCEAASFHLGAQLHICLHHHLVPIITLRSHLPLSAARLHPATSVPIAPLHELSPPHPILTTTTMNPSTSNSSRKTSNTHHSSTSTFSPPQNKHQYQSLYKLAFRHLNKGIDLDEKHKYNDATASYIQALEIIAELLRPRGEFTRDECLSKSQIDNLKKHQRMFMDRLQEIENLQRFGNSSGELTQYNHNATGKKSHAGISSENGGSTWLQSFKGLFSWQGANQQMSQPAAAPQQPQQQQQQITTPIFASYRKRDANAGPIIYNKPYVDANAGQRRNPTGKRSAARTTTHSTRSHKPSSNVVDLTGDSDEEDALIRQVMNRERLDKTTSATKHSGNASRKPAKNPSHAPAKNLLQAPELRGVDKTILNRILDDVIESSPQISFDEIGGLDYAKQILRETVIFPQLRPDLFDGLRTPTKGILLNGPPGTGKTLLARCVASNVKATFFNVSASSLVSKYHGEGEKIVKALFAAARVLAPSVIFIDEVDSVLTARSESEHEASRRLKTQILIELDGVNSGENQAGKHLLVMGATNRPHELDDAALRRFPKRIYIPLPEASVRKEIISHVLKKGKQQVKLSKRDYDRLAELTEGYSGSDLNELCKEAVMQPIRELGDRILNVRASDVRSVQLQDFESALQHTKPTANKNLVKRLEEWNRDHGSGV